MTVPALALWGLAYAGSATWTLVRLCRGQRGVTIGVFAMIACAVFTGSAWESLH